MGIYQDGKVQLHDLKDRVVSMSGQNGRAFGLTKQGKIYTSNSASKPDLALPGGSTFLDPTSFKTGAGSDGDQVLLTGPEGLLHHNLAQRTYRSIPKKKLLS